MDCQWKRHQRPQLIPWVVDTLWTPWATARCTTAWLTARATPEVEARGKARHGGTFNRAAEGRAVATRWGMEAMQTETNKQKAVQMSHCQAGRRLYGDPSVSSPPPHILNLLLDLIFWEKRATSPKNG